MRKRLCIILSAICLIGVTLLIVIITKDARLKKYSSTVRKPSVEDADLPPLQQTADYLFDPCDKEMMSGFSDYIAAAYVEETNGTVYQDVREDAGQVKGTPYTEYNVTILRNIKGDLTTSETVKLYQYGGVSIDEKNLVFITPLLESGRYYVLYLSTADDHNLYVNMSYRLSDIAGESDRGRVLNAPENSELLQSCIDAYQNENLLYAPEITYFTPYDVGGQ